MAVSQSSSSPAEERSGSPPTSADGSASSSPSPLLASSSSTSARKQNQCPHCPQGFSKLSHLRQHLLVHGEQRIHVCPHEGCNRSYKRADHLTRHVAVHDGVLHQCPWPGCMSAFTTKANMLRHHRRCHHTAPQTAAKVVPAGEPPPIGLAPEGGAPKAVGLKGGRPRGVAKSAAKSAALAQAAVCAEAVTSAADACAAASGLSAEGCEAGGAEDDLDRILVDEEATRPEPNYGLRYGSNDPAVTLSGEDFHSASMHHGGDGMEGHLLEGGVPGGHNAEAAALDSHWNTLLNVAADSALASGGVGIPMDMGELLQRLGDAEWLPSAGAVPAVAVGAGEGQADIGRSIGAVERGHTMGEGGLVKKEVEDGAEAMVDMDCAWLLEGGVSRDGGEVSGMFGGADFKGLACVAPADGAATAAAASAAGSVTRGQREGEGPLTPELLDRTLVTSRKEEVLQCLSTGGTLSSCYLTPQNCVPVEWSNSSAFGDAHVADSTSQVALADSGNWGASSHINCSNQWQGQGQGQGSFFSQSRGSSSGSQWCGGNAYGANFSGGGHSVLPGGSVDCGSSAPSAMLLGLLSGQSFEAPVGVSASASASGGSSPPLPPLDPAYASSPPLWGATGQITGGAQGALVGSETQDGAFLCGLCMERFQTGELLQAHSALMHRTLPCPECGRNISAARLRRHVRERHGLDGSGPTIAQHVCHYGGCQKSYSSKFNLSQHIQVAHHHVRAFECTEEGCNRSFVTRASLQRHVRNAHHENLRPVSPPSESCPDAEDASTELAGPKGSGGRKPYAAKQFVTQLFSGLPSHPNTT